MKLHHIGYAVSDIMKGIEEFQNMGYQAGAVTDDLSRNVRIAFLKNDDALIELVAPLGPASPVDGVLASTGATPYHLCYEVKNLEQSIADMKAAGWRVLKRAAPAPAISNSLVAFLWKKSIGLIELVQCVG